jgi:hypothetical protein
MNKIMQRIGIVLGIALLSAAPLHAEDPAHNLECDEFISGGGFIVDAQGQRINVTIVAGMRRGELFGHVTLIDHARKIHVRSSSLREYWVQQHEQEYRFLIFDLPRTRNTGDHALNEIRLQLVDVDRQGTDDLIEIQFHNGGLWYQVRSTLGGDDSRRGGGNLRLHRARCDEVDLLLGE